LLSISEKETRAVKRFKNILLIANRGTSDQAILRRATSIAETNRAQLVVVDVIEELPRDMQKLIVVITPMEIQKRVIQERQKQLERLVAPIRKEGLRIGVTVLIGTPFLEIIQLVLRQKHDLVIMAAGGRNRLEGPVVRQHIAAPDA
jgi:nucleotide-binding universal stress UspA family protein